MSPLKYWLAINKVPNVGPVTIKKLWERFGSIEEAWKASERSIFEIEDINRPAAKAFIQNRDRIDLDKEIVEIEKQNISVLTLDNKNYPVNLKNIYDPPPVLYFKGQLLPSDTKTLGIVGTRKASRYGLEIAKKLAEGLASLGITIVSGLALGIDTAAHKGAVEAKGRTLAVLGSGVDVVYPPQNRDLAAEIEQNGAVISEFPLGTKSEKGNFPRRNRIISGLSIGVIVVEGHYDSGAMITAKYALDQGREVFAVPGNVQLEQSKGPHWLIKQGAKLVESIDDVLEDLNMIVDSRMTNDKCQMSNEGINYSELNEEEKKIMLVMSQEPKHLDNISTETGLSTSQVSGLLMMLEIKKAVRQLPGKMFVLY